MKWIRLVAAGLAVTLAACADNEPDVDVEPASETATEDVTESLRAEGVTVVDATLSEWSVALSQDSIPAGTTAFQLRNNGSAAHTFEIEAVKRNGDNGEWKSDELAPGGAVTMTLNLEPGEYEVYCPLTTEGKSHRESGMRTRLRVY